MDYNKIKKLSEQYPSDKNLKQALVVIESGRQQHKNIANLTGSEKAKATAELDNSMRLASKTFGMYIKKKYGV